MILTRIAGTGRSIPEKVLTNNDLTRIVDTNDEWIRTRTGIRERRMIADGQVTSDMAAEAAARALEAAGVTGRDLETIIVATVTPDTYMPACAVYVQQKLGESCPAFDVSAACAGFCYGLQVGDALVRSGTHRVVLLIGAEALTRVTDWTDRTTCILFGDGAGAVVLRAEESTVPPQSPKARGVLAVHLGADGAHAGELAMLGGGSQHPASAETVAKRFHYINMNGRAVFIQAVRCMSDSSEKVLAQLGMKPAEIDLVIPHQANLRIIEGVARRLEIPMERVLVNIERYGNTSSASIPIALDEAVREERVRPGMNILVTGLGGGLAWGSALIRW
jgi:3-oxoacyl-[acyl-carrier-protein] synthase-3